MKIMMIREYSISYGKDYDLVEVAEVYLKNNKPLAREDKVYHGASGGHSVQRLIKVLSLLPKNYASTFVSRYGFWATVTATRQAIRRLSVSPELNGSSSTDENNSSKRVQC